MCSAPRGGHGPEESGARAEVLLPRRGVFAIHRGRDALVADPTVAVVMAAGEAYRFSHPADGGDACVVLAPRADVFEEALGDPRHRHGRLRPATQLAVRALTARLGRAHGTLADEDDALTAVGAVADDLAARPAVRAGAAARRRVRAAQELLAADPGAPPGGWRTSHAPCTPPRSTWRASSAR